MAKKILSVLAAIMVTAATVTTATIAPVSLASAGLLDPLLQYQTFPGCDDSGVLNKIIKRFNWAENRTWGRGFSLDEIERTRERLVKDTHDSPIPRRYCRGHALLSNGKHPTVYYLIEGGQGFAGNSYNVEFCISGLDEWNDHDGSCRALRY